MKNNSNLFLISGCMILILVCAIISVGCTSNATPVKSDSPSASTSAVPVSTPLAPAAPITTNTPVSTINIPLTTASLSNGMIISYPANWEKQELSETSLREYGRVTTNIANFFSPSETGYTTLSIDVDPQAVVGEDESDRYFNLATVEIQKSLGTIDITRHQQQGPGYKGPSECQDCKVYNLEFNSKVGARWYQFINADGTFIVITMKNPISSHTDLIEMLSSIKIPPPLKQKQR